VKEMAHIGKRIKELRSKSQMSQEKLAQLLGVSRPTMSQIENGQRKVSSEDTKKLADIFRMSVDSLLDLVSEPEVTICEEKASYEAKPKIRINVPQKHLEKFKEVLLYILNKVGAKSNIGETVVYKLLYFIDFNYYEKYEEQLIGATYIKNRFGPTPVEFIKIVETMIDKDLIKVKSKYFDYHQAKYLPLRKPDLTKFKASEIAIIDDVLNRLSDMNASQISDYSHGDVPWMTTEEGEPIEYESVFYRTLPYSVREYSENIS
jgi:transcriptional regulator with XRE-family HTH domain